MEKITQTQRDRLAAVLADTYDIHTTPTHDPRTDGRVYEIAVTSTRTRRQILADLPDHAYRRVREQMDTYTPDLDLDAPETLRVTLHSYADRRSPDEHADPDHDARMWRRWLDDAYRQRIPAGYTPAGAWADHAHPGDRLRDAQAAGVPAQLVAAIAAARTHGMSLPAIAETLGISRQRLWQIRRQAATVEDSPPSRG